MDAPKDTGMLEDILLPLGIATVGWVIALFYYVHDQGKQSQKLDDMQNQINRDEQWFAEVVKELKDTFVDVNGDPRLMPTNQCLLHRDNCTAKFTRIEKTLERADIRQEKRDNEMFERLRAVEKSTTSIATHFEAMARYPTKLSAENTPQE